MVMSTADSWLNTSSVIISHDLMKKTFKSELDSLITARVSVFIIGGVATIVALFAKDILKTMLWGASLYMPMVTVPLLLTMLGFNTNKKVVLSSMLVGAVSVIYWKIQIQPVTKINSVVPGMCANLIATFIFHYLGRFQGGWESNSFIGLITSRKKVSISES